MTRPVRPVALVMLTACMIYPGITHDLQGLYPFVTGEYFNLVGERAWLDAGRRGIGIPLIVVIASRR